MKTLKANRIEKEILSNKEMNLVRGGEIVKCECSCYYADKGGSSTMDNGMANMEIPGGGKSEQGDTQVTLIADQRIIE